MHDFQSSNDLYMIKAVNLPEQMEIEEFKEVLFDIIAACASSYFTSPMEFISESGDHIFFIVFGFFLM